MTIIVSGMIATDPGQGGAAWAVLQYVLGLKALGHDVYFVEQVPATRLRPAGAPLRDSANARYFQRIVADFGLEQSAALLSEDRREGVGIPYPNLLKVAKRTDLLLNISGILKIDELLEAIPVRVYLDLDPAFAQLWHSEGIDIAFERHTHFVTIGKAIGRQECPVPTCGVQWITTLQPMVLSHWPVARQPAAEILTTIGNWRGYGSVVYKGVHYGQKAHSLRPFFALPKLTDARFLLAMAIHSDERGDLSALEESGWGLVDPLQIAGSPQSYQRFIRASWGEFGIAKSGYVASRCAWFSDRSICYLASGRPVIAQDTGFSDYLPAGEGLFAFRTLDDVLGAIDALRCDYDRHANTARSIAETYFDARKVLSSLLDAIAGKVNSKSTNLVKEGLQQKAASA